MKLSDHQREGKCWKCQDDASKFCHCSWCGADLKSTEELEKHLDESCGAEMKKAFFYNG